MSDLQLRRTEFGSEHHSSSLVGPAHNRYVSHAVDIYNELIINHESYWLYYQVFEDNELELSVEGGSERWLLTLLEEVEDWNEKRWRSEIEELAHESIDTKQKFLKLRSFLQQNHKLALEHMDTMDLPTVEQIMKEGEL